MKICLITPAWPRSLHGNRTTAVRWSRFLRQLGHKVALEETWDGSTCDLMIALHARRSYSSIARYAALYPKRPLMVVLTGTDLYRDIRFDEDAKESLELATVLVVLQEAALADLEPRHRAKTRIVHQSAEPVRPRPPTKTFFDVCVAGSLRAEKDPFRIALAATLLPSSSRIRVTHVGGVREAGFAEQATMHMEREPRYRWLGEVPRWRVRRLLSRARLVVQSSTMEGGANAVSEALSASVPVIASEIPGNVGLLGEDYPGYYPVGDERALSRLLARSETDGAFYTLLKEHCEARKRLVMPEQELSALEKLLREACSEVPPDARL